MYRIYISSTLSISRVSQLFIGVDCQNNYSSQDRYDPHYQEDFEESEGGILVIFLLFGDGGCHFGEYCSFL